MKKQTSSVPSAKRRPRWGVALALVIVAASLSAAMAQSTLRFVDAGAESTIMAPSEPAPVASAAQPNHTELHFVEVQPSVRTPNSSTPAATNRVEPTRIASTLTLVPAKQPAPAATQPKQSSAWDLRFVPEPQQVSSQPAAPARLAAPNFAPAGTELFATAPESQPKAFQPRIAAPLEHIPVPMPQQVAAQPVRTPAPTTPTYAPLGTELFTTAAPKQWDPPALDYGAALKQVEPPKPLVAAAKPMEPTRITAKPIVPSVGTELFAARPPQPPQPSVASELDFSNVRIPAQQPKPLFAAAPPVLVAPQIAAVAPAERLVPAAAMPPVAAKLPFAYESGSLAATPPTASPKPAFIASTAPVSDSNSMFVATEPAPLNSYKFRFATTTDNAPITTLASAAPAAMAAASSEPESMLSDGGSAPCGCNTPSSQCDCPYSCGQSGTHVICGVDCGQGGAPCCSTWSDSRCIPWSLFGPGEYVGPARPEHVSTYYLRVNDFITLTFIESRKKSAEHYRIGVGDRLQIEWLQGAANTETPLNRELLVQPDGTVTLPLIGEVTAAGKTINDFRDEVVKLYGKYQRDPQITVTPISVNVGIQDLLKAVTAKNRSSGQEQDLKVTPEGTIQAAGIGSVYVQGLTLDELKSELEARYAAAYGPGLNVSPALTERATSFVFIGGEVKAPGRYTLEGPTTVMQAIALAGGWNIGGNVRQVVIFRRDENWCLKATKIDVRAPLYGQDPCPVNDVWLRENDLVLVPKSRILCATDVINLYFTRGVYAVFPINYVYDFSQNSGIVPVP